MKKHIAGAGVIALAGMLAFASPASAQTKTLTLC